MIADGTDAGEIPQASLVRHTHEICYYFVSFWVSDKPNWSCRQILRNNFVRHILAVICFVETSTPQSNRAHLPQFPAETTTGMPCFLMSFSTALFTLSSRGPWTAYRAHISVILLSQKCLAASRTSLASFINNYLDCLLTWHVDNSRVPCILWYPLKTLWSIRNSSILSARKALIDF